MLKFHAVTTGGQRFVDGGMGWTGTVVGTTPLGKDIAQGTEVGLPQVPSPERRQQSRLMPWARVSGMAAAPATRPSGSW